MLNRPDKKQSGSVAPQWLRGSRISRGQSMVEFALGATLALVVMLVGIQFAIIGQSALAVSQGSSALARYAAVNPGAMGYNGTVTLNTAEENLLSPSILTSTGGTADLTVTINSYTGTTSTETSTPVASQDRVVIALSYNAASKIVLPSTTLLGITFPSTLTASDSQLYE